MPGRLLVKGAYRLQGATGYRRFKHAVYNLLENPHDPAKRYFDLMMMTLIFASIMILIRDVKHPRVDALAFFNDYVISIIFLIEYLLRFWVSSNVSARIIDQSEKDERLSRPFRTRDALTSVLRGKWRYVSSPAAIIDLLAIIPFFHEVRLFRLFVIFRAFKIFRYTQNLRHFAQVLYSKKSELLTLFTFAGIVIFISAVLIYVMEALNPDSKVNTLFDAVYWSVVTISTVGYGDVTPVTYEGQIVALVVILAGVVVLSFSTSIVVSAFTEKLVEIRHDKQIYLVQRLPRFYLICGFGAVARLTAGKLHRMGRRVVIIDADADRVEEARKHRHLALQLDPGSLESYAQLQIDLHERVEAVLLLGERDIDNIVTALTLRSMHQEARIVSLLHEKRNRRKLGIAGVGEIVYAQELIGQLLREYSGHPIAFEALHALRAEDTGVLMDEIVIDAAMLRRITTVEDLGIRGRHLILLGIEQSDGFVFNPSRDRPIHPGDRLIIIAEKPILREYRIALHR